MVETEFAAVSIVLLVSFRCFDGFVPNNKISVHGFGQKIKKL